MRWILAVVAALLAASSIVSPAARAETPADPAWTDAERWAWSQIAEGRSANFDLSCGASTSAPAGDAVWNQPCRIIRGSMLEEVLIRAPWRDAMQHQGLRFIGARITGGVDLGNAHIGPAVVLARSHIDGDVILAHGRLDSFFALDGSAVSGMIDATAMISDSDVSFADGRTIGHIDGAVGGVEAQKTVSLRNARIHGSLYLNGGRFHQIVDLRAAHIDGEVQTSGAHVMGRFWAGSMQIGVKLGVNATTFDGDAVFANSTIGGLIDASESHFGGKLNLVDCAVAGDVFVSRLTAGNGINLSGTKIGGYVSLAGSAADGPIRAEGTQIAGDLQFDEKVRFSDAVTLSRARIGGDLVMTHTSFSGPVVLRAAHVIGNALMAGTSFAHTLDLIGARIDGDARLTGVQVSGDLVATNAAVAHDLDLDEGAHVAGSVNLFDIRVANTVHMERAAFDKDIVADDAQVSSNMLLTGSTFRGDIHLAGARIGGDLQLGGVQLGALDLTGAAIDGSLIVASDTVWLRPTKGRQVQLSLVNARVGRIQDGVTQTSGPCPTDEHLPHANGWPLTQTMALDGFSYGHLGATAGATEANMRERQLCWWRWWLSRDPHYSSQPYVQLASILTAHGDQDSAAVILYYGRVRETQMAWEGGHYLRWSLLALLNVITGYGIGTYTFRALWWIILLTVIGAFLLKRSPGGAQKTLLWRAGASLTRVLPGIEINSEFTEFFNDPDRQRLHNWQVAIFSAFVIIGWVLGLFLVAAMTGLTQHS